MDPTVWPERARRGFSSSKIKVGSKTKHSCRPPSSDYKSDVVRGPLGPCAENEGPEPPLRCRWTERMPRGSRTMSRPRLLRPPMPVRRLMDYFHAPPRCQEASFSCLSMVRSQAIVSLAADGIPPFDLPSSTGHLYFSFSCQTPVFISRRAFTPCHHHLAPHAAPQACSCSRAPT